MTYPNLVAEEDRAAFDHLHRQDEAEADRAEQEGLWSDCEHPRHPCEHALEEHEDNGECTRRDCHGPVFL